ncbi:MAG: hypothetical protein Q4B35_06560 [Slackia sp.]|nr:hypothetical protein [Slackia sp.]
MSILEKIDMFSSSMPRMCLYCAYGYPVVFGRANWLDVLACGAHLVMGLRSKKETLTKSGYVPEGANASLRETPPYMPMVGPRDRCDLFEPIRLDGRGHGFVNARKFALLDGSGMFDDLEWKKNEKEER